MATKTDKGESTSETGRANGGREHLAEPVGAGLRKHREEAGMSLRALAREVGVSPSLISQIEHGKATPSVATLYAIVSELGISLDELFFDNPRGAAAISEPEPPRAMDPGNEQTRRATGKRRARDRSCGPATASASPWRRGYAGNASPPPTIPASSSSTAPIRSAASRLRPTT